MDIAPGDVVEGFTEEMERLTDKPYGKYYIRVHLLMKLWMSLCQLAKVVCTGAGNPGKWRNLKKQKLQ